MRAPSTARCTRAASADARHGVVDLDPGGLDRGAGHLDLHLGVGQQVLDAWKVPITLPNCVRSLA